MSRESQKIIADIEHAITNLRCGQGVCIDDMAIFSAEMLAQTPANAQLVIAANRAQAIFPEYKEKEPISVEIPADTTLSDIAVIIGAQEGTIPAWFAKEKFHNALSLQSALHLMRYAELLPAVITEEAHDNLKLTSDQINHYEQAIAENLKPIVTAPLKLKAAQDAEITLFRAAGSNKEHYAITVGNGAKTEAPYTRLHSSCFTGDVLGSLRCDCGDQLYGALQFMAENGGGIVLYLMQEGRGIGLANKLRTYALQAQGLDTVDANAALGFDDDERPYLPAVSILKQLGITQVRLLTNNPRKVEGLEAHGIQVAERISHAVEPHEHNHDYLETKFDKLGHIAN